MRGATGPPGLKTESAAEGVRALDSARDEAPGRKLRPAHLPNGAARASAAAITSDAFVKVIYSRVEARASLKEARP
jgi:hypothetical protein